MNDETFLLTARRCKRCGGILISRKAVADGFGHTCKKKFEEEKRIQEQERKLQISFFDNSI